MKKAKLVFALLLSVVALTSCATSFQKESPFTNGYSDFRFSEDTFVVTFRASEHTPAKKVVEYALRRGAQVALEHGFRYFSVLDETRLHYPSLRLTIQCFHSEPPDREWIDANLIIHK